MPLTEGLKTSLNAIREMSIRNNTAYHQYVPIIDDDTDIGSFGTPILNTPVIMNEFVSNLVNRIVYTQFERKYFRNPLQVLEGDRIPLGYAGQEIYVNPAKGRKYNVNDFAGLLVKYEADVKVQYTSVNMDLQYPVTVSRHKLKQAFVSWDALDSFIGELSNSLYNGAYIDEYQYTKELAEQIVEMARTYFKNIQTPSSEYNAWEKVGGEGRPVKTWANAEDIVFLVRNDIRSKLDVQVLANAFNLDKATLLGNILPVDNFDIYDDDDNKIFDGSKIIGMIADKSWFRIKRQDMYLDEFYNANNRTWQYYLNLTKMYNYSLFANGVIFATELPEVVINSLDFKAPEGITLEQVGDIEGLDITVNPAGGNNTTITYESDNQEVFTVVSTEDDDRHCTITATGVGDATLKAKAGNVEATVKVKVLA